MLIHALLGGRHLILLERNLEYGRIGKKRFLF